MTSDKHYQDGVGVLQYAQDLLLYLEYQDGVKEGDSERVMRCLKYLLPPFKVTAFNLQKKRAF